jgi:hypothetical protein
MNESTFTPGSLIRARNREWMVLSVIDRETYRIRPLTGTDEDHLVIHIPAEIEPVIPAKFPIPQVSEMGSQEVASLLKDALILSLRRGAGPFRCFAQISVEPRAYQLVPLLMALKQEPVRLLIADDVGVGKTIEACLIAKELLERGDIERMAVLCPPHLVEQWISELDVHFHIRAVPVKAETASRLERGLPPGESIFSVYPYTVVSLDYIKNEKRRNEFLRACPEFTIVDEAHTCVGPGRTKHQRYDLIREISESKERGLVLLSATPHSGDENSFYRLLGLLDPKFEGLLETVGKEREQIRERLSLHFVQRRRPDLKEWQDGRLFPDRKSAEITYSLTGKWDSFLQNVLSYCRKIVQLAGADEHQQRLNFWGTLALMRCVSSSPHAAMQSLRSRIDPKIASASTDLTVDKIFDGTEENLIDDDTVPVAVGDHAELQGLIKQAQELSGQSGDPKLKCLTEHLKVVLEEGFSPVIFCRFIPTAHYLGEHLAKSFDQFEVEVVTGELNPTVRREIVEELGQSPKRILIATDCLSEGINLQDYFDSIIHYDLSWNPTRHEQREGRVDRFGQKAPVVKTTLMYGENNPVDGAVLGVILRKAEKIKKELGVPVPLPDDNHHLSSALMKAVLLKSRPGDHEQLSFLNIMQINEANEIDTVWKSASEKAKKSRTVFAQRRLSPDDVLPELKKTVAAIGDRSDVERFSSRALSRLGTGLEENGTGYIMSLTGLPADITDRICSAGLKDRERIEFSYPSSRGFRPILRSHPLVHTLADGLLERTLLGIGDSNAQNDPSALGRCAVWQSSQVDSMTTIALLRLRHQIKTQFKGREPKVSLVEEATALAWQGKDLDRIIKGQEAMNFLSFKSIEEPALAARERIIKNALSLLEQNPTIIDGFASERAQELLSDHYRVKGAARSLGIYNVTTLLPPDIIGIFVILPKEDQ